MVCLGVKGVSGHNGVFREQRGVIVCFLTFVCYLRVNRKLNNMLHDLIITRAL